MPIDVDERIKNWNECLSGARKQITERIGVDGVRAIAGSEHKAPGRKVTRSTVGIKERMMPERFSIRRETAAGELAGRAWTEENPTHPGVLNVREFAQRSRDFSE